MLSWLKRLFEKKPPFRIEHPKFGVLTYDSGLWSGRLRSEEGEFSFTVAGTTSAPDASLLEKLERALARFAELKSRALDFLASLDPHIKASEFRLDSLDLLWPHQPERFFINFSLQWDRWAIWRVEFLADKPNCLSRDG